VAIQLVLPPTFGRAAWEEFASWWLSRYKPTTQQTYATYLPRWTAWCAGRGLDPLRAGRADVEL
jgi:integrase/recombinase XerD